MYKKKGSPTFLLSNPYYARTCITRGISRLKFFFTAHVRHSLQAVSALTQSRRCEARKSGVYRGVNEHFKGEYNVAFKRGQRVLAHFAERSNEKELNAEITLLDNYSIFFAVNPRSIISTSPSSVAFTMSDSLGLNSRVSGRAPASVLITTSRFEPSSSKA